MNSCIMLFLNQNLYSIKRKPETSQSRFYREFFTFITNHLPNKIMASILPSNLNKYLTNFLSKFIIKTDDSGINISADIKSLYEIGCFFIYLPHYPFIFHIYNRYMLSTPHNSTKASYIHGICQQIIQLSFDNIHDKYRV